MSFICADTEDNSKELAERGESMFNKQLTQVAAITREGKKWYCSGKESGKQFLSWLVRQPEKRVYFHNTQYDLGALFGDRLDALDVTLVGGRFIKGIWPQPKGEPVQFLDSFNIWPMSVAKLAPAFGLAKLEFNASDRDYVFRDVEIIHRAMDFAWRLAEQAGLAVCPNTLGSFGVKLWQEWGGEHGNETLEFSDKAIYGGRVEIFREQSQSNAVCYTDINSLYPFVMTGEFPTLLEPVTDLPKFGIVEVTLKIPECDIAPLPMRNKEGRIFYPWGTIRGTWTAHEVKNAIEHGAKILKLHQAMGTEESSRPYKEFVDRLYMARKLSESGAEKLFFKLLMNTLYGRLGSKGIVTRSVYQTPQNKWLGVPYGEKVLVNYTMPVGREVDWTHCAYLTSYARLEIQKYLRRIPAEQLIYTDTDCVIFDVPDAMRMPDGGGSWILPPWYFGTGMELGEMKLEGWGSPGLDESGRLVPGAQVWLPKTYRFRQDWKAKGVPKRLAKQFIESGRAEYDLPFRYREAVTFYDGIDRNGNKRKPNTKKLGVWHHVEKRMNASYDKKKLLNGRFYPCKVNITD